MSQQTALVVLLVALGVVTLGKATRPPAPGPVPPPAPEADAPEALPVRPARQLGPLPATMQVSIAGTPAIDLAARLATRRRIEREGRRVYFDSMLVTTDSVIVRWADHSSVVTVRFESDSTLRSWREALDDARTGMGTWTGNPSGFSFRETTDSAADVVVRWSAMMGEESQLGLTEVTWDTNGIIRSAKVTLGLLQNPDSIPVPSRVRRRVAAHEFGHVLGLPHSDRNDDLMFGASPVASPSRRDFATLRLLYAVAPGPIRTP